MKDKVTITHDGKMIIEKQEVEEFYYHTYQKIITWKKDVYSVKANSKEEADEFMRQQFLEEDLSSYCSNPNDEVLSPRWCDHGDYYEGDEDVLTYEANNFSATQELYDDEGNLIEDNEPLEVKREKKIEEILK